MWRHKSAAHQFVLSKKRARHSGRGCRILFRFIHFLQVQQPFSRQLRKSAGKGHCQAAPSPWLNDRNACGSLPTGAHSIYFALAALQLSLACACDLSGLLLGSVASFATGFYFFVSSFPSQGTNKKCARSICLVKQVNTLHDLQSYSNEGSNCGGALKSDS